MVKWEYEVGPLKINFRVLLEPKGFLRIILFVLALLAFSITAGFSSGSTNNSMTCLGSNNMNNTVAITFSYPYSSGSFGFNFQDTPLPNITDDCTEAQQFSTLALSSSAQFFVAMGVLTMIYVIAALLIYMMFLIPELFIAKWLVIGDFFVTIAFGVLYLIACIAWSAGAAQLNGYIRSTLTTLGTDCYQCQSANGNNIALQTQFFTAPAISLLFGWVASFVWLCSSWFVYKDTMWHKDDTGPLAKLYQVTKDATKKAAGKVSGRGGGGEGGEEEAGTTE